MAENLENLELAIKLTGVKKRYKLGAVGGATLQEDLQSWWAKVRGKPDPNLPIGQDERLVGKSFMALNGIDLEVYKGEAIGIIGGNGAGKSTMLKILSRVTAPTEGKVQIWGRIASMLEVGTGFHGELTGRENIYMNGAILGMTQAEIDAKMEDIIEFSEVRDFIDTPVKRYSSGMYVKLAFSVAAHLDSEIMIMDEVLAVGDMAFQKKCLDKMRDAAKKDGRTVLYVSHNMNTIRQLCDRCVVLNSGKLIYEGDTEEAIQVYLGSKMKSDNCVELSEYPRDPEFSPHTVTMTRLEALNNETSIYNVGSKLDVCISCRSCKTIKDAYLRVIIKTVEGTPVTMQTADTGVYLEANKNERLKFTLDISRIVPGRYTISPVIYEVNEFGGNVNLDGLKDVYCFEIAQTPDFNNNMIWQPRYWGHFYCTPLMIDRGV